MNEAEWLKCTDPRLMLESLRGKASERKLRLFSAASCRRIWDLLKEQASRDAIEQIEKEDAVFDSSLHQVPNHAASEVNGVSRNLWSLQTGNHDDWETEQNANTVAATAAALAFGLHVVDSSDTAASAEAIEVALACVSAKGEITGNAVRLEAGATWKSIWEDASEATWNERWRASYLGALRAAKRVVKLEQAVILKDLFGNPFRRVQIERSWFLWNDSTIPKLAKAIYDGRAFDRMPILADALEEAECTDRDILSH